MTGGRGTADQKGDRPLLVIQHVPWEGPHGILASFPDAVVQLRHPLYEPERGQLPDPSTIRGAVVMGGPMSVNDAHALPVLADEIAWLGRAATLGVPVLGICLGAQLLAKAAGATVCAAHRAEIGVHPVTITAPDDPLLSHLDVAAHVMHWHGEEFTLPPGATPLAHSAQTPVQAFRLGANAWGMLFHLEVDDELLDSWLAEPIMATEAERALGNDYRERLRGGLAATNPRHARAVFDEFAKQCKQHISLASFSGGARWV